MLRKNYILFYISFSLLLSSCSSKVISKSYAKPTEVSASYQKTKIEDTDKLLYPIKVALFGLALSLLSKKK